MSKLLEAARNADWMQVVLNQGPPCFHLADDERKFCLRAERWDGHKLSEYPGHRFVSLADLLSPSPSALAIAEQLEQDSVLLDDDKCQHAIYDLTVCDKCLSAIAERLRKAAALLRAGQQEQKEQP